MRKNLAVSSIRKHETPWTLWSFQPRRNPWKKRWKSCWQFPKHPARPSPSPESISSSHKQQNISVGKNHEKNLRKESEINEDREFIDFLFLQGGGPWPAGNRTNPRKLVHENPRKSSWEPRQKIMKNQKLRRNLYSFNFLRTFSLSGSRKKIEEKRVRLESRTW